MAKPQQTLKAILLSLNLVDEKTAESFTDEVDPEGAKRLVDVLMTHAGGRAQNLSSGQGGFLTGLRRVVESRAARDREQVDPLSLSEEQKRSLIEANARDTQKADEVLLKGLKLLLDARDAENLAKFAAWPGELSDEDFPRKVAMFKANLEERNDEIIRRVTRAFQDESLDMSALLKKHRNDSADANRKEPGQTEKAKGRRQKRT